MKYLFWNTHKNLTINPILCDLMIENNITIAILAEYTANPSELIELLDIKGLSMQQYITIGCERIKIIGVSGLSIAPQLQTDQSSIQVINNDIILCV